MNNRIHEVFPHARDILLRIVEWLRERKGWSTYQTQARQNGIHAGENATITAVLLLWNSAPHIAKRPFTPIQLLLLLVHRFSLKIVHEIAQYRRSIATHGIAIANLSLLHVHHGECPVRLWVMSKQYDYVMQIDRDNNYILAKQINLFSPSRNWWITTLT